MIREKENVSSLKEVSKLWQILEIAIHDLNYEVRTNDFKFDVVNVFTKNTKRCTGCALGAIIAHRFNVSNDRLAVFEFNDKTYYKFFNALAFELAFGNIEGAYYEAYDVRKDNLKSFQEEYNEIRDGDVNDWLGFANKILIYLKKQDI